MYKNNKQAEMDELWSMYGNQNIKNTKSKALDAKYWENNNK